MTNLDVGRLLKCTDFFSFSLITKYDQTTLMCFLSTFKYISHAFFCQYFFLSNIYLKNVDFKLFGVESLITVPQNNWTQGI